jgi:hypothetical protein
MQASVGCQGYSLTSRLGKAKDGFQALALDNDVQMQVKRYAEPGAHSWEFFAGIKSASGE